jgi:iron transport multicopper oxidase
VHDPESPYKDSYDEVIVLTISDWFHTSFSNITPVFSEPTANSSLLNDTVNTQIAIKPETTYLFRVVNLGAFNGQYFWIENHDMVITEVDGVYTKEANASMIYLAAGQRCSFLLKTKADVSSNFPMVASIDTMAFMGHHEFPRPNATGWLVYDNERPLPAAANVTEFSPIKDMELQPYDMQPLLKNPAKTISLRLGMKTLNGLHQ